MEPTTKTATRDIEGRTCGMGMRRGSLVVE
jgi:hypothetical protein